MLLPLSVAIQHIDVSCQMKRSLTSHVFLLRHKSSQASDKFARIFIGLLSIFWIELKVSQIQRSKKEVMNEGIYVRIKVWNNN